MMTPTAKAKNNLLRSRNRLIGTALVGCSVFALAACSSDSKSDGSKPSSKPTNAEKVQPSKSSNPQAAEKKAVLSAYQHMQSERLKAYGKASEEGTELQKYATLDALGQFRLAMLDMKKAGTVVKGTLGHLGTTATIQTGAKPPSASVSDCVDLSQWKTWDTKADKEIPMPSAQPQRYRATAKLEKWKDGWIVTSYLPHGNQEC
ncbi:hypothetical protein [Streptomyces sp. NBC_01445]|uniref:hypothetical protein n=1 Tax=Streptomyces sp. NBC_01445 TaxID=2903869 RepID=UPI002DDA87FC|nr:hypothetical protein [Streptomyces sp. NBC_01445]WSE02016.1 hypothetical protein OG574_00360 [Streptomyces sp. NBC_01445]WSE10314.1 hypothetical protein OG574_47650 [Streptomyces sp. NBC_01445]WSE11118.1 hypothetical protein OG574_48370 [Streptomyces sp. NBC_01445]